MDRSLIKLDAVAVEGKLYRHAAAVLLILECVVVENLVRLRHRSVAVVYVKVKLWVR